MKRAAVVVLAILALALLVRRHVISATTFGDTLAEEAVAAGAGIVRLYGLAGAGVFLFFQFSFDYVSWMQFHLAPFFMRESQKSFSQLTGNLSSCEVHRQY
jgi:hypothetical protein